MWVIRIADPLPYLPYYVCTYILYRFVPPILAIRVHFATYDRLYLGFVRGRDYMRAYNVSRYIRAYSSLRSYNISRNVRACAYVIFRARSFCANTYTIFVHLLPRASLLVFTLVYVSMYRLTRASVHMPPRASMLAVDVPRVCFSFCKTHSCELTLALALGHIMSISRVILGIPCIIAQNLWNIAPWNVLVNKNAYIYPVG